MTTEVTADVSMCIETVTGKLVNPSNPSPDSICVEDIAWALSRIPRFAGHTITEIPYNVAQHSVYVSELVEGVLDGDIPVYDVDPSITEAIQNIKDSWKHVNVRVITRALFHDGHEAYFGDVPSPIKKIPELTQTFKMLEKNLDIAIANHLGIGPVSISSANEITVIKFCDKLAQAIEGYQYMPSRGRNWNLPRPSLQMLQKFPLPMTPLESYKAFLNRYEYLKGQ